MDNKDPLRYMGIATLHLRDNWLEEFYYDYSIYKGIKTDMDKTEVVRYETLVQSLKDEITVLKAQLTVSDMYNKVIEKAMMSIVDKLGIGGIDDKETTEQVQD